MCLSPSLSLFFHSDSLSFILMISLTVFQAPCCCLALSCTVVCSLLCITPPLSLSLSLTHTYTHTHTHTHKKAQTIPCNVPLVHHLHTNQISGPTQPIFRTENQRGFRHISALMLRSTLAASVERDLSSQQRLSLQPPSDSSHSLVIQEPVL